VTGGDNTRWVLGFDGGCLSCTDMARQIEILSGGRLTARSLRDPEVAEWRRRTLGEQGPWTPMLFSVSGTRVRAWRGSGMALRLTRLLGPASMGRIAFLLGKRGAAFEPAPNPARRQFVRTAAGAALGLALLAGRKGLDPSSAVAAGQNPPANFPRRRSTEDLAEGSALLASVRRSADYGTIARRHGSAAISGPAHHTYEGMTTEMVSFILRPEKGPARALLAYFDPAKPRASGTDPAFHILGFEWLPINQNAPARNKPMSGRVRFITPEEVAFVVADYQGDQLVAVSGERPAPQGVAASGQLRALDVCTDNYWLCVKDCIAEVVPNLPWYLRVICEGAIGGCLFGVNPIACGAAVGCLGAAAARCGIACNPC